MRREVIAGFGTMYLALALLLLATAARAETRALVVGIDAYKNVRHLQGAVADAGDISAVLKQRGVSDISVFLDSTATRINVLGTLDAIVERSKPDDLVIITFAGHGAREQWGKSRPKGIEEGDAREVFLFYAFSVPDKGGIVAAGSQADAGERIAGAEINVRLQRLEDKGVRTIFLADSCFGGGLTRSALPTGLVPFKENFRFVPNYHYAVGQDPLDSVFGTLPPPVDPDSNLPNLMFLAAVDDAHESPEIAIPRGSGQARGALSYSFARVIDGTAKISDSATVKRGDLIDYLNSTVRALSDDRQDPDLRPQKDFGRSVFNTRDDLSSMTVSKIAAIEEKPKPVTSALNAEASKDSKYAITIYGAPESLRISIPDVDVRLTSNANEADILLSDGHAFSKARDLIMSDVNTNDLPGIVEREISFRRLQSLSLSRPHSIRLKTGDIRYRQGDHISIDASAPFTSKQASEFYALFSISGNGIVQFLYPDTAKGESKTISEGQPLAEIKVVPPFGQDTLVLVTSTQPIDAIVEKLKLLDGSPRSMEAVESLEGSAAQSIQIGLQQLYTAPD